jgi:hypothetical protein
MDEQESSREQSQTPKSNRTALMVVVGFCVALALLIALNMK